jgi:hypothetical protein
LSQALKPAAAAPLQPVRSTPPPREWQAALEHDRAAAADNAEDFTRYPPSENIVEKDITITILYVKPLFLEQSK